ncbi:transcription regulator HTH, apses-type DNA-binding domain-containing protein, partial [Lineolata rhizophorae]
PTPKREKLPKDAAVFTKAEFRGEVLFWPQEAGPDEKLAAAHRKFELNPMGHIADYCRHIPYKSDKKTFVAKTGRDSFEVFQYTFKLPWQEPDENGKIPEHVVMWDYNVGLVRITPFFKCFKYPKTMPAKCISQNPGLSDLVHSITGGSIVAQGYWVPYKAAKAIAATFCYEIRHALTPVFGPDFVNQCIPPGSPNFQNFKINPAIV